MALLIALVGAAVLLSALVLVAAYRGRDRGLADPGSSGRIQLDPHGAATRNTWTFTGGGGLG